MCFCKKEKEKIRYLQGEIENKQKALDDCFKVCKQKDERYIELRDAYDELKEQCQDNNGPGPGTEPIKSLNIKSGQYYINGHPETLLGIFKREGIAVGSGDLAYIAESEMVDTGSIEPLNTMKIQSVNYTYSQLKQAVIESKMNYIRFIAPLNLDFMRKEIISYLAFGIVCEVELYDSGNPNRPWQAPWEDAFNKVKDLPIIFDAHNEFMDDYHVNEVIAIIDYITSHGGLIGAGAWGSSNHGQEYADELKANTSKYQIVTHHREWTQASIQSDREPGKPLAFNELHTRDHNVTQIKALMAMAYKNCEATQVYSLLNFGMGPNSDFQKLVNYVNQLREG